MLTETRISKVQPRERAFKLFDERKAARAASKVAEDTTLEKVAQALLPERDPPDPDGRKTPKKNSHRSRIELHVCPRLSQRPIASITTEDLWEEIRKLVARGRLETARRTKMACKVLWEKAVDAHLCPSNVAAAASPVVGPYCAGPSQPEYVMPKAVGPCCTPRLAARTRAALTATPRAP